jgi:hypothetical protein
MVHFQLIAFEKLDNSPEVLKNLTAQINYFRNHSAIFGWYLADEPDGQGISPSLLQPKYDLIKQLDSTHPVSMVFCAGGASNFLTSLDLIMVDIYPIPNSSARSVANGLSAVRKLGKPIMFVPQSFGGGENWAREPSLIEERLMTYIGLLYDVVAIQFFVRSAPLVFPYAASAWSEIRILAGEIFTLTSALTNNRLPNVTNTSIAHIDAGAWNDLDGSIVVLAVNLGTGKGAALDAATFTVTIPNCCHDYCTVSSIISIFEDNAKLLLSDYGNRNECDIMFSDYLRGGETRAYRILFTELVPSDGDNFDGTNSLANTKIENLVYNPSYEISYNSASVPDGNYISMSSGTEDASTFFGDGRISVNGRQSLRLSSPTDGAGLLLSPYTIPKLNQTAIGYIFSVWLKGNQGGEAVSFHFNDKIFDTDGKAVTVTATTEWTLEVINMKVGKDITTACPYGCRGWLQYGMTTKGVVWLDMLSLSENLE